MERLPELSRGQTRQALLRKLAKSRDHLPIESVIDACRCVQVNTKNGPRYGYPSHDLIRGVIVGMILAGKFVREEWACEGHSYVDYYAKREPTKAQLEALAFVEVAGWYPGGIHQATWSWVCGHTHTATMTGACIGWS